MNSSVTIGSHSVGAGHPCYFIAEAGVNHNGSMELAVRLVDAAVEARADAVKFQAFDPSRLVTGDAPQADYQTRNTGERKSQRDMLTPLAFSSEQFRILRDYCQLKKIDFLCTPFDEENAAMLLDLGCNAIKVGSGDFSNHLFLARLARLGLPLILSTGMADEADVLSSVNVVREEGNQSLVLLQCVSDYPAPPESINLRAMLRLGQLFRIPVGLSDHTVDDIVPLAAVALGASVVEKHLTLDRGMPGPDHAASFEPREFGDMIRKARVVESALGDGLKRPTDGERRVAAVAKRSLAAAVDILPGTEIREHHLTALRPAGGLQPSVWKELLGKRAKAHIGKGVLFREGMLE